VFIIMQAEGKRENERREVEKQERRERGKTKREGKEEKQERWKTREGREWKGNYLMCEDSCNRERSDRVGCSCSKGCYRRPDRRVHVHLHHRHLLQTLVVGNRRMLLGAVIINKIREV
jgi:hypothetical protein